MPNTDAQVHNFAPNRITILFQHKDALGLEPPEREGASGRARIQHDDAPGHAPYPPDDVPECELVRHVRNSPVVQNFKELIVADIDPKKIASFQITPDQHVGGSKLMERLTNEYPTTSSYNILFETIFDAIKRTLPSEPGWSSLVLFELREDRTPDELLNLVGDINGFIRANGSAQGKDITAYGAAVDWYITGNGTETGGSGPGCPPWRVAEGEKYRITTSDTKSTASTKPIEVAIFDTAPSRKHLCCAYEKYKGKNEVLCRLLGGVYGAKCPGQGASPLTIHHADERGVAIDHDATIHNYKFEQPDHGLFIASIVHQLAPTATIHLVEVLNKNGVATVQDMAKGLEYFDKIRKDRSVPLLINCSFMVTNHLFDSILAEIAKKIDEISVEIDDFEAVSEMLVGYMQGNISGANITGGALSLFATSPKVVNNLVELAELLTGEKLAKVADSLQPLYAACVALANDNTFIIAAAGNFNDDNLDNPPAAEVAIKKVFRRLQAGFPAAFPSVLGVGALTNDNTDIPIYSNAADIPSIFGVLAFGGEIRDLATDRSGKPICEGGVRKATNDMNGIVGVYTSDFYSDFHDECSPTPIENLNGYAMWAGTSFATAVVTGTLARLAAQSTSGELGHAMTTFATALDKNWVSIGPRLMGTQVKDP